MMQLTSTRPGFLEGALVALFLSVLGFVFLYTLEWVLPIRMLMHLLVSAIGLAYILYLLSRTKEKTGRLLFVSFYLLLSFAK